MQDIDVGDKLKNGSTVTGIIQFAAADQNVYKLDGVLVTGEHRVYHPMSMLWMKVKNHPESEYIPHFKESFVYCLNTTTKTFTLGNTLFSDWDDIDTKVWEDLRNNCTYLPANFTLEDIHRYLDSGFQGSSTVILHNGVEVPLYEVKVNDILASGEKIVGVVKIAAQDMPLYKHTFNDSVICGSRNVHLAIIHNEPIHNEPINNESIPIPNEINHSEPFLYHFLTDTKFVTINNIQFKDYNSGIDIYLR
jgi:hypothetical protein